MSDTVQVGDKGDVVSIGEVHEVRVGDVWRCLGSPESVDDGEHVVVSVERRGRFTRARLSTGYGATVGKDGRMAAKGWTLVRRVAPTVGEVRVGQRWCPSHPITDGIGQQVGGAWKVTEVDAWYAILCSETNCALLCRARLGPDGTFKPRLGEPRWSLADEPDATEPADLLSSDGRVLCRVGDVFHSTRNSMFEYRVTKIDDERVSCDTWTRGPEMQPFGPRRHNRAEFAQWIVEGTLVPVESTDPHESLKAAVRPLRPARSFDPGSIWRAPSGPPMRLAYRSDYSVTFDALENGMVALPRMKTIRVNAGQRVTIVPPTGDDGSFLSALVPAEEPPSRGRMSAWEGTTKPVGHAHMIGPTPADAPLAITSQEQADEMFGKHSFGSDAFKAANARSSPVIVGASSGQPAPRCGQTWRLRSDAFPAWRSEDAGIRVTLVDVAIEHPSDPEFVCRREDGARMNLKVCALRTAADYESGPTTPETQREAFERVVRLEAADVPSGVSAGRWLGMVLNAAEGWRERAGYASDVASLHPDNVRKAATALRADVAKGWSAWVGDASRKVGR